MNNYNFKIGDRVRIRSWEDMEKEFGYREDDKDSIACDEDVDFVLDMYPTCGCIATICDIIIGGEVDLRFDNNIIEREYGGQQYCYTLNMIEPL